jgi:hypothetical protein
MKKLTILFTLVLLGCLLNNAQAQPQAPSGLTAARENFENFTFVKLTWNSVNQHKVTFYVYKKEGSLQDTTGFQKFPQMSHNNGYADYMVKPGKTYTYYVTARDKSGESLPSDTVEITLGNQVSNTAVSGKISDETTGTGIKGASISFMPVKGWNASSTRTDSSGNYSVKLYPSEYLVHIMASKYYPEFYNNAQSIFDASKLTVTDSSALELNINLKAITPPVYYTLSGKITDSSGTPVKSMIEAIELNSFKSFMHHYGKDKISHAVTDSIGNYSLRLSQGDSVIIYVHPMSKNYIPEFYNNKKEFAEADPILVSSDMTGLDFIVEQKAVYNNSISGTIKNQAGTGVVASVAAFKLHEKGYGKFRNNVLTDSLGNYQLSNLTPGDYALFVIPFDKYLPTFFKYDSTQTMKWKEADSIVVTETSKLTGMNVTVLPVPDSGFAEISGFVRDNNGAGVSGAIVFLQDINGNNTAFTSTSADGNYNLSSLAPGTYTVLADKFSYSSTQQTTVTLDYISSQSQNVSFTLSPTELTSVNTGKTSPDQFRLAQNYPNPFNPTTVISYQIPASLNPSQGGTLLQVTLKIYDMLGREVATLVNKEQSAGNYQVQFDAGKLSTGMYMYVLKAGSFVQARKMMLPK